MKVKKTKKIQASEFVPGRVYSVIYLSDVAMVNSRELSPDMIRKLQDDNVRLQSAEGKYFNPMSDIPVTVRRVSTVQAAGEMTWENFKMKNAIETGESTRAPWYHVSKANDCIVVHNKTGEEYLRGLPRGISKEEYFVGREPATPAQVETIRAFKKNRSDAEFVILSLSKLVNVAPLE